MTDPKDFYEKYSSDKYRFFIDQLLATGLTPEKNEFKYTREGRGATCRYMSPDNDGNVRFYVPNILTGDLEDHTYGNPPHQKIRDWYLTRWKVPKETKTGLAKYTPVKGAGTRCLFTQAVISAYRAKTQIKTLFFVEGYKKALAAWAVGGLPIIGISGLTGFKEPSTENQRLRKEIKEILTVCKVQNVVIIYDSDLFDLSLKKDTPETKRPNNFYRAALLSKVLFEPFADVYLAHPQPHPVKKHGLDDLLLEHRNISPVNSPVKIKGVKGTKPKDGQQKVLKDLITCVTKNKHGNFFNIYKLSSFSDYKIKQIFHLDNVQAFYEFYRSELLKNPRKQFRFYTYLYQVNPDGTIGQIEDNDTRHLSIQQHFGKLVRETDKGKRQIANFTIRVLFQIDSEEDPKRICEIVNYENSKRIIEVDSKTFISLADFQALMISKGNFIWTGNKEDLLDLMTILFKHEKPAIQITQLGWQPIDNFYAFSNGIVTAAGFSSVDEYGMVTHNEENYYLPAWSKFNARDYDSFKDMKRFSHFSVDKPVAFRNWKSQFSLVYGKNGEIAVCFYIASLFSDIVFSHKSGIGFPLLWSAGKPQTGKSTICESLLSMFGEKSDPIGLAGKSTIKYFISRFAQVRNGIVHLDEYSNAKVDKSTKETLKNIYDRIGYGRKTFSNDFRTNVVPILSTAMVSGEEIPADNHALFTRAILLIHNKDKYTPTEQIEFRKLKDMEESSLTHITLSLLCFRQLIEDNFNETYLKVFSDFYEKFKTKKIEDRMLKNAAWIVTPVKILLEHEKIEYNISYNDLMAVFFDNIEKQKSYMEANTDVSRFWGIIEMLYARNEISQNKGDFKFVDDLLAIRLNRFHHYYSLEARKLGYEKILDKSSLENYLSNEPYHVEMITNGRKKQVRFKGTTGLPAMFFQYADLGIDLTSDPSKDTGLDDDEDTAAEEALGEPLTKKEKAELPF